MRLSPNLNKKSSSNIKINSRRAGKKKDTETDAMDEKIAKSKFARARLVASLKFFFVGGAHQEEFIALLTQSVNVNSSLSQASSTALTKAIKKMPCFYYVEPREIVLI